MNEVTMRAARDSHAVGADVEDTPDLTAELMNAGVRAERDRLLREVLYLRTGQMVGGRGDDLDIAASIASQHAAELDAVRADLAITLDLMKNELQVARQRSSEKEIDLEITLEAARVENEVLQEKLYRLSSELAVELATARSRDDQAAANESAAQARIAELSAHVSGANARIAELQMSTSWRLTAPLRRLTARAAALR